MKDYIVNGFAGVFQPEEVKLLVEAYDDAWRTIQASGALLDGRAEAVREILARHIIQEAMHGERDPAQLRDAGLARLTQAGVVSSI